ncbi:hypothetical protein ACFX13_034471 [Malus domestica]
MTPQDQRSVLAPLYYDVGFVSPPTRRFSPQQNSRWFDDSHRGVDHNFRGGRFAGRRFQPGQRFDSERSFRRLNRDGYSEPVMRPDGRYEIVHRVRRFDSDGGGEISSRLSPESESPFGFDLDLDFPRRALRLERHAHSVEWAWHLGCVPQLLRLVLGIRHGLGFGLVESGCINELEMKNWATGVWGQCLVALLMV